MRQGEDARSMRPPVGDRRRHAAPRTQVPALCRAPHQQERGFTEADEQVLREVRVQILRRVAPEYRQALEPGQAVLSTYHFYQPILPLLCDVGVYRRTHPNWPPPEGPFTYPQDAATQLQRSVELHTRLFGRRPTGLWPSEGSVSDAMVDIVARAGFTWMATDEEILACSRGLTFRRDSNGVVTRDEGYYDDQTGGGQAVRVNFADAFMGGKIDLTARLGVNDYSQYSLQDGPTILRDNRFAEEGSSGEVGAVFTRPMAEGLTSETRFIREWNDFENASTSRTTTNGVAGPEQRFASEGNASETILRSLLRWERSPALTLEAGGELAYNMLEIDQALTDGGVVIPLPSDQIMVEETRGELFGKATWRLRPNLNVEGGLRLEASTITQSGDADQEKSFFYAKPRLLVTWTPRPQNQVPFRLERHLGPPEFGDFAAGADLEDEQVFGGNVNLEPEERWISELTYERRFLGDGILSIGYRHDEIIGVIDRLPLPMGLSAVGNIGDGTLDQLAVNFVLPLDWTGFSGGQFQFRNTWNNTAVDDPTSGQERPISGVRPSQPAFTISQDITTWKISWAVTYPESLRQFNYAPDQVSGFTGSDYFEANIEYKPTPTLAIRAQVNVWNDFQVERTVFADRSLARPIAFTELRPSDPRTFWQIRVRKTF